MSSVFKLCGAIALVVAGSAWWITATGSGSDEISIEAAAVPSEDRDLVKQAATVLLDRCPRLVEHRGDVESITASTMRVAEGQSFRGQPWTNVVEITVVLTDDPKSLPNWTRAAGHHLHYALGGAEKPGISMMKSQAHAMCSDQPVSAAFVPDDRLNLIDDLHG